jgi:hypothetical protein
VRDDCSFRDREFSAIVFIIPKDFTKPQAVRECRIALKPVTSAAENSLVSKIDFSVQKNSGLSFFESYSQPSGIAGQIRISFGRGAIEAGDRRPYSIGYNESSSDRRAASALRRRVGWRGGNRSAGIREIALPLAHLVSPDSRVRPD